MRAKKKRTVGKIDGSDSVAIARHHQTEWYNGEFPAVLLIYARALPIELCMEYKGNPC